VEDVGWQHKIDPLLLPFLLATTETESQSLLAKLLSDQAEPIIRNIVGYKLRSAFDSESQASRKEDMEDVCGEVRLQLLAGLKTFKAKPDDNPISRFQGYVAVITYRACYEYFRQKYPQRHSLKNKLRYLLIHEPDFALWDGEDKELYCGLAPWQGKRPPIRINQTLRISIERAAIEQVGTPLSGRLKIPDQLAVIFKQVGGPIELDELVTIVAELWGISAPGQCTSIHHNDGGDLLERLTDSRANVAIKVEKHIYLQKLWIEICQLPLRQRAAILLNLKDDQGKGIISLFPLAGVATIRQIAVALEIPFEEFAGLWNKLPLDDAAIGRRLNITRQQVINLRKSARQRLIRRLKGF